MARGTSTIVKSNLIQAAAVSFAYFVSASLCIALTRYGGGAASVWIAGPILFSALALRPRRQWSLFVFACMPAAAAATTIFGIGLKGAVPMAITNISEALAAICLMKRLFPRFGYFRSIKETLFLLVILGGLIPLGGACAGAWLLCWSTPVPYWVCWRTWLLSHSVGYITFVPLIILTARSDPAGWLRAASMRMKFQAAALMLFVAIVATATFAQSKIPLLALPFLPLMIATLRLGLLGSLVSIAMIIVIASGFAFLGLGPTTLIQGSMALRLQVLQLYFATIVLIILPTAAELSARARLARRLAAAETSSRSAQRAIAQSEARYRALAESTSDMITLLSLPDLRRTYVSPASQSLVGFRPKEMILRHPIRDIHPADMELINAVIARFKADKTYALPDPISYRMKHKSGHWTWVETSISFTYDAAGEAEGLICSVRDIDGRRRAELARTASEARFRLLAENTSELIVLGHDDGRRSYISPASTRLLGFTPTELEIEMQSKRWVHPDDVEALGAAILEPGHHDTTVACRVRRRDKSWIWVEAIFRRIPNAGDEEPTIVATFRDITERQSQAQALREAKEAAEAAQTIAEQASRAKSDFLATMSHEIRTPLNAILGFADLLRSDRSLPPEGRRHVDRIRNAGSALRAIVDDILDFSQIEAGKVYLKPRPLRLALLVDDAISIVQGLAQKKQLVLHARIDPMAPVVVVGDYGRLRQILINLLNNAIKFTREGVVELSVCVKGTVGDEVGLRFSVSDTGIGIETDKLSRIFQRFSQVDGSSSREYGGTGLGLAICRSLVEAMGGTIGVESVAEQGSTFWLDLTLPTADELSEPPRATAPSAEVEGVLFDDLLSTIEHYSPDPTADGVCIPLSRERQLDILLVEDVILNQELVCSILRARGHCVDVVGNGSEAIMAVADKAYDLVLMDLQMPYVDGTAATRAIRSLGAPCRFVPIVALTAAVLQEQTEGALAAGMNGILTKPISMPDLEAVLMRATRDELREPVDPEALDQEVVDQLGRAIGDGKIEAMRSLLMKSLAARFTTSLTDDKMATLKAEAHASIAGAAMLGFVRFGAACRLFMASSDDTAHAAYEDLRRELYHVVRTLGSSDVDAFNLRETLRVA